MAGRKGVGQKQLRGLKTLKAHRFLYSHLDLEVDTDDLGTVCQITGIWDQQHYFRPRTTHRLNYMLRSSCVILSVLLSYVILPSVPVQETAWALPVYGYSTQLYTRHTHGRTARGLTW